MTTERPDARTRRPATSVPTPRTDVPAARHGVPVSGFGVSGVPTSGFGVSALSAQDRPAPVAEPQPERRSRSVTVAGALVALVAVAAAVVAFRIMVPTTTSASATTLVQSDRDETREQPGSVVIYGQPHTYGDGLEIAVNAPQRYEPSRNATRTDAGIPVKLQVVVTNRSDEPFRPNTLQMQVTSAGQPGVAIWDPDQGIALTGPDVSIPAGTSVHFHLAFAVADPGHVEVQVTPALFGYGSTTVRAPA